MCTDARGTASFEREQTPGVGRVSISAQTQYVQQSNDKSQTSSFLGRMRVRKVTVPCLCSV